MNLDPEQQALALYAVNTLVTQRLRSNNPLPPGMRRLHHDLEVASPHGTETVEQQQQWNPEDIIDTAEAAAILGCSTRWVRAIRSDLDGHMISGRWAFQRDHVIDYHREKGTTE
ncbi:hypothetical protein HQO84_16710 [Rhodococcus fascians]|nr:hypothetical protein [Rhodococcus fascians]MBY3998810.1 hypothetical protein [Rhodococcus fascians]MBY4003594.1 hypothetical protein [Rhodococcus fascians]MBY4008344.1 hypothetical protein [Rhodococcus fascians]MBY4018477.1 hypothetical protein [Rhodococcus fascians]